ncbi:hypothetical protein [Flavobacterium sp. CF136]|uniref:hypothetical protein n=1 Tax=Flavobacterium sp. (strain CF136) TaxID=1144313 RepID=UPI000271A76E|nr:hypothetical protein [Flavobacterium sp. CF136]EJL66325.1 hypothetical protein PMI10_00673 [Flavobacterium sp. CF136]
MPVVRAKFVCESVTNFEGSKTAKLRAVYGTAEENADFTKYTPNGSIEVNITNDAPADGVFKPGKNYFVDFTEIE